MTVENNASYMQRLPAWITITSATLAICACFFACTRSDRKSAGPPEKVTMAFATLPETALAQIALAKGFFRAEGLEAIPRLHSYGKLALQDVLEGNADMATVAETPLMFAILSGADVSVIASIQNSNMNHAIVARRDRGVLTPQDLKGKRIAMIPGTTSDYFMDAFMATHGISRSELKVVNLKPEECQNAIVGGEVDAISIFQPFLMSTQNKLGKDGITFYDKELYTETFNVVARRDFPLNRPATVRKVIKALLRAEEFLRKNPAEAQKTVAGFCRVDPAIVRDIWADTNFAVTLDQLLILALEDEARWAIEHGLTSSSRVPNFLEFIYFDGLGSVKPAAVSILK